MKVSPRWSFDSVWRLIYKYFAADGAIASQFGGCGHQMLLPLVLIGLWLMGPALAQQTSTPQSSIRFLAADVYVDSKDKPLAAYQLEFSVTNAKAKIVGIEGGEHPAFCEAPHYDPKAIQKGRVMIAAFSTEPINKLPTGNIRVATIHVQTSGTTNDAQFQLKLHTAADVEGRIITAKASIEPMKNR